MTTKNPQQSQPHRRRMLRALAAAGLLGSADMIGMIRTALAAGANPVPPGLHKIKGKVTLNGQPAREGQLLKPGDTIVTGPGAEALYVLNKDAFLQRESSTVQFGQTAAAFMRVVTGRLLSVFGKGERRNITVGTATIGIRGTACYIEEGIDAARGNSAKTYFCLCYGEAEIIPTAAPAQRETIHTEHHDHPLYIHADPTMTTSMVPAQVINHSDAELVMLENLVGRWPPFYGKGNSNY